MASTPTPLTEAEQRAMGEAFRRAYPLREFPSDAELDESITWRGYFDAGAKAMRAFYSERERVLREALRQILDLRDTEWAVDPSEMDQRYVAGVYAGKLEKIWRIALEATEQGTKPASTEGER